MVSVWAVPLQLEEATFDLVPRWADLIAHRGDDQSGNAVLSREILHFLFSQTNPSVGLVILVTTIPHAVLR